MRLYRQAQRQLTGLLAAFSGILLIVGSFLGLHAKDAVGLSFLQVRESIGKSISGIG
jgi:hypothetical protein